MPSRLLAWKTFSSWMFNSWMMESLISFDMNDDTRSEMAEPLLRLFTRDSNSRSRSSAFSFISTSESRRILKCSASSTLKPGKSESRCWQITSSTFTKVGFFGLPGRRMKRGIWFGKGRRAAIGVPSSARRSESAKLVPPFGMNGNGCAGSAASGVKTGKISCVKLIVEPELCLLVEV